MLVLLIVLLTCRYWIMSAYPTVLYPHADMVRVMVGVGVVLLTKRRCGLLVRHRFIDAGEVEDVLIHEVRQ